MDQVRGQARCSKVCKRVAVSTPACHVEVVRLQEANQRNSNGKKGTKGEIILQNMCQRWTVCIYIKEERETPTPKFYSSWKGWYRGPHHKFAGFLAIRVHYIFDTTHVNVETFMQGACGCPPRCTVACPPILSENCTLCRGGRLGKARQSLESVYSRCMKFGNFHTLAWFTELLLHHASTVQRCSSHN